MSTLPVPIRNRSDISVVLQLSILIKNGGPGDMDRWRITGNDGKSDLGISIVRKWNGNCGTVSSTTTAKGRFA